MAAMPAPSQYAPYALSNGQGLSGAAQPGAHNMQALNLPPIRSGDGGPQSQQPPQQPPPSQPGQGPQQYYLAPGQPYPGQTGDIMRYGGIPIPPADSRIMSGGRHKKEIKRRTKTGCLTCRKRRIKVRKDPPSRALFACCADSLHQQHHQSILNGEMRCSCRRLNRLPSCFLGCDRLVATVSSENCLPCLACLPR